MMDRDKVISDLEQQITWIRDNDFHKFPGWGHAVIAMKDAIALLKAQEPMKPIRDINGVYYCGNCDTICVGYEVEFTHSIIKVENYCHKCGRKVKWE